MPILQEQAHPRPSHEEVRLEQPLVVQKRHPLPEVAGAQQRGSQRGLAQDHGARRARRGSLVVVAVIAGASRALLRHRSPPRDRHGGPGGGRATHPGAPLRLSHLREGSSRLAQDGFQFVSGRGGGQARSSFRARFSEPASRGCDQPAGLPPRFFRFARASRPTVRIWTDA
eukprot:scaffold24935_cov96-Isochrysis_galbana.AAC.2